MLSALPAESLKIENSFFAMKQLLLLVARLHLHACAHYICDNASCSEFYNCNTHVLQAVVGVSTAS